MLLEERL
ncbi:hypothetical protein CGLO_00486 [Colletotrichum gloeosporioides Cg-14]|nr:hypothetical protein CGLO_00486 [Colletotrichum gloeosporioides Cg-14]